MRSERKAFLTLSPLIIKLTGETLSELQNNEAARGEEGRGQEALTGKRSPRWESGLYKVKNRIEKSG